MSVARYELSYLQACVEILEDYLLSHDIYWTVGATPSAGEPPYRQLTLGGLLLADRRLSGRDLPVELQSEFLEYTSKLQVVLSHRRVAWERKSSREFSSRLKMWGDFLNDYRASPENHFDRYAYEVGRRVMLHLLDPYARDVHQAEREMLASLDKILRAVFLPGDFIWEPEAIGAFQKEAYWYLYGKLRP